MENLYNFVIDTSFVNVASNSNYTSYTFNISRTNQNKEEFENLLIEVKNNNLPKAFLLKYKLTAGDNYTLLSKKEIEYNLNEQGLVYYGQECHTEVIYVSVSCSGGGHHYDNSNGDCTKLDFYTITLSREVCSGAGGSEMGDDGGGFTPTTNPSTGGSGSGSGSTQTSYTHTMPPLEVKKKTFIMDLKNNNLAAYNWLRTQSEDTQGQIYNYLAGTGTQDNPEQQYSQDKCDFVRLIINHCSTNNLTPSENFEYLNSKIIIKKINDQNLDACAKSVLQKLKNLTQSDLSTILTRFGDIKSNYTLNFSTNYPSDPNALASTNWVMNNNQTIVPYNYSIKIRPEESQVSTELAIAGTLLHEIIHSYFLSLIDDCMQKSNCTTLKTFPELWNFYVANQPSSPTDLLSQHNQIALSYVNIMGACLQEYVTGTPVQPGQQQQVYTDVAWHGLQGTIPFNALPQADKDRINFRFENVELLNQSSINTNGITINPVGTRNTPC